LHFVRQLTDFGDSAVVLPLALLVFILLLAGRERRLAIAWLLSVGGCGLVMLVLKLAFTACGHPLTPFRIFSPSGHTAMSTAVYLSAALLIGATEGPLARMLILAASMWLVAAIGVSRVILDRHNLAEVLIGLAVGLAAVAVFYAVLRRRPNPTISIRWLVGGGFTLAMAMHGTRLMIEPAVHSVAGAFRLTLPWCR
jgi:membrane-associated phospholipid phosphatase